MASKQLYIIIGLGLTGVSCARYLLKKGMAIVMMDTRNDPPYLESFRKDYPDVPIILGKIDAQQLAKADAIVLSPGISLKTPEISEQMKKGTPVIGDIELFAQEVKVPIIAITGTNAKSTVTTLVGKMAEAAGYQVAVGGNLGVPALDLLTNKKIDLFVLEVSSFQLETTYSLQAKVATILNVTEDHMDRYASFADYCQAKQRIHLNSQLAVCNRDDKLTDCVHTHKYYFTLQQPHPNEFGLLKQGNNTYLAFGEQALLAVSELPVIGKHYQANALAALAIGYAFGLSFPPMLAVLKQFKGLPHRCEFIREHKQVRWYNDSKGTNVGATNAAIEGLGSEIPSKLILIAGGVGKNADFSMLLPAVEKYVRHVVLIGEAAAEMAKVFQHHIPFSFANSLQDAVLQAAEAAQINDCVLLSPACASFDMFKNYAHRGEVFKELVAKL